MKKTRSIGGEMIIREDETYAIGMLFGKGDILFSTTRDLCNLQFGIRFRRPTVHALRRDNISVPTTGGGTISIQRSVFNEFRYLEQRFTRVFGVRISLQPLPPERSTWERKGIFLRSDDLSIRAGRLQDLFGVSEVTRDTLQHIPTELLDPSKPLNIIKAFLQGITDSCGLPPSEVSSAYSGGGTPRLQIELEWRRWYIPVEVCRLFQERLGISVNMINYGHPLIRGINSYRGQNHQFRIYLDQPGIDRTIFRLNFKQQAFKTLLNRLNIRIQRRELCPSGKRFATKLPIHCRRHNENDRDLPTQLRNIHFFKPRNYQICEKLGCTRI